VSDGAASRPAAPGSASGFPWRRALLVWCGIAVAMVVQGTAREALVTPAFGALRAHQLSSVTGAAIVFGGSVLALPWLGLVGKARRQWQLGGFWVALTVAFELGFGHWVAGHSWARLLADYDVTAGRMWLLVLAATACSPRLAGRWLAGRGRGATGAGGRGSRDGE